MRSQRAQAVTRSHGQPLAREPSMSGCQPCAIECLDCRAGSRVTNARQQPEQTIPAQFIAGIFQHAKKRNDVLHMWRLREI